MLNETLNMEFNNEFDILYNSITSNQAPALDTYEKSVFLTQAQNDVLKHYFNPILNKSQAGFDGNEVRQIDFSMVIKHTKISADKLSNIDGRKGTASVSLGDNRVMMILNEFVHVNRSSGHNKQILTVIPIDYLEYQKLMSKPYKRPPHYQAWRLLDSTGNQNSVELIAGPNDEIVQYIVRYVKRPEPIILFDLGDDINNQVSIEGKTKAQSCELDPILHPEIIQRAVELAKAAYTGDLSTQIIVGQSSQTDVGAVQSGRDR